MNQVELAPLRTRLLDAASTLTVEQGWAAVTMSRLATEVGISRQTVYNEIGTKTDLAEAMILAELERFLARVTDAFDRNSDDLNAAIAAAVTDVLTLAQDNPLLHAVVSATHGADTELLPLLTTHASSLLELSKLVVRDQIAGHGLDLDKDRLDAAIDMVVRVVLSHVMQPSGQPSDTAEGIAWVAARVLSV